MAAMTVGKGRSLVRFRLLTLVAVMIAWENSALGQADDQGARLAESCFSCHGTGGRHGGKIPALAGQAERTLIERMESLAAGDAQATIMSRLMRAYSKEELAALARYLAQVKL